MALTKKIELRDITELTELEDYYRQEGLETSEAKIDHLRKIMEVGAVRCEFGGSNTEDVLIALEDNALVGSWKWCR